MRITFKKLKSLPVQTESGVNLGKVVDLEFDLETQSINNLVVVSGWFGDKLLINFNQIKKVTDSKIIVSDTLTPETAAVEKNLTKEAATPVIESETSK
jgi:sporulation protein YlmC with PRC-barrel domain